MKKIITYYARSKSTDDRIRDYACRPKCFFQVSRSCFESVLQSLLNFRQNETVFPSWRSLVRVFESPYIRWWEWSENRGWNRVTNCTSMRRVAKSTRYEYRVSLIQGDLNEIFTQISFVYYKGPIVRVLNLFVFQVTYNLLNYFEKYLFVKKRTMINLYCRLRVVLFFEISQLKRFFFNCLLQIYYIKLFVTCEINL